MFDKFLDFFRSYESRLARFNKTYGEVVNKNTATFAAEQNVSPTQLFDAIRSQFIGPNAKYYISRFDTKGFYFHPTALLGPFWFAWRRMYKGAIWKSFLTGFWWFFLITYFNLRAPGVGALTGTAVFMIGVLISLVIFGFTGLREYQRFSLLKTFEAITRAGSFDQLSKMVYASGRTSLAALLLVPLFFIVGAPVGVAAAQMLNSSISARSSGEALAAPIAPAASATCRIISAKTEVGLSLSDDFFAYDVNVILESVGGPGTYNVRAVLRSSDGNFERAQDYAMSEGTPVELTFNFPEATWGGTNVQGQVFCQ